MCPQAAIMLVKPVIFVEKWQTARCTAAWFLSPCVNSGKASYKRSMND
jgi:hypothetical protein